MDGDLDPGLLAVVARRRPLLERLRSGDARVGDLAAEFDVSRSTVRRAAGELTDADLAERDGCTYGITLPGRLALREFDRAARAVAGVVEAGGVLADLPADPALDPAFFAGARVVTDRDGEPGPTAAFEELVTGATRHRAYLPVDLSSLVAARPVESGPEREFLLPSAALERLLRAHRDRLAELTAADRVTLHETTASPPYGVAVAQGDRRIACALVPDDGDLAALAVSDRPAAVARVEEFLEELRADASRVSAADG